jgi:hypothetical protein
MGRQVSVGITPSGFGNLTFTDNSVSLATLDADLILSPTGNGTVQLPSGYLARSGIGNNSVLPKIYIDNNISPGTLFVSLE